MINAEFLGESHLSDHIWIGFILNPYLLVLFIRFSMILFPKSFTSLSWAGYPLASHVIPNFMSPIFFGHSEVATSGTWLCLKPPVLAILQCFVGLHEPQRSWYRTTFTKQFVYCFRRPHFYLNLSSKAPTFKVKSTRGNFIGFLLIDLVMLILQSWAVKDNWSLNVLWFIVEGLRRRSMTGKYEN